MEYISEYLSPLGRMVLSADEVGLTGLWFEGQRYAGCYWNREHIEQDTPTLDAAKRWLDMYFVGREPDFRLPLHFTGTAFQNRVWEILCTIPYGSTVTYGAIAALLAEGSNTPGMSAQAVGGAVGRNRISIMVPCHRVVCADGGLTGYAGGLDRKMALLQLEKTNKQG